MFFRGFLNAEKSQWFQRGIQDFPENLLKEGALNFVYVEPPLGIIYKHIWDLCALCILDVI